MDTGMKLQTKIIVFKKFLKLHFFISRQNNMWKINIFYTDDDIDKTRVGVLYGITHGKEKQTIFLENHSFQFSPSRFPTVRLWDFLVQKFKNISIVLFIKYLIFLYSNLLVLANYMMWKLYYRLYAFWMCIFYMVYI